MNILFISQLYPLSEESKVSFALHYFVKEWAKNHHVEVIRPYLPMEEENYPDSKNIVFDTININIIKPFWIPVIKKCIINKKNILQTIKPKPDVIICHLYNSYLTFSFLKEYFKVPLIIGIHRSDVLLAKKFLYRKRIQTTIKKANLIIYRSLAIKTNFEKYIKPSANSYIAYSGIPKELIDKSIILSKSFKKTKNVKNFLTVCRLIKVKQIDKVIIALNSIKKNGLHLRYTIIGEGEEREKLEKLTKKFHLEKQIKFLGQLPRNKVFKYMEKNDFFIMPSYNETFGLVFLEAMANGCIVIGSKGWGIDGIVKDKINGFLCDPYSPLDIFNKIQIAMNLDVNKFNEIRNKSLKSILNFGDKERAMEYLSQIDGIMNNKIY
jgi:L-malate glycosyltransferase